MHLYLHIPFCRQACHYCDFHFSTVLSQREVMVNAMAQELEIRKDYLSNKQIDTIYLGGGTPSLLSEFQLNQLFDKINQLYSINPSAEITLEANPEDLSKEFIQQVKKIGINRLSVGIQTFNDSSLKHLHRNHSSQQSIEAIKKAQDLGLENISIDVIYGLKDHNLSDTAFDIQQAISLNVDHISAYSLTIEPRTVFGKQKDKGLLKETPDNQMAAHFELSHQLLQSAGFEAYEVSNFAKNKRYSKHNSSYWNQEEYLGIGPSAHSFNYHSRQWNVANNKSYLLAIEQGNPYFEVEHLSPENRINEYIMTRLRTMWGLDLAYLKQSIEEINQNFPSLEINEWKERQWAKEIDGFLVLTESGKLIADKLSSDIFLI
ncbi:radical SAM family heme chaperone HemW [Aquirufa nivalisilvae]|uniref:radical SAM family heme chaperone HemW n=1 Tax=Aquirufa nivalisilvae TaxID=2516557 RepID=UPI0022A9365A|nr:radical SAM family heme chaperone HemW [Aquirufa nivalisilvae]MCZ2483867.1 radical SAM family heme chaperone HemW [Aquirufa nivalisilvae]